MAKLTKQEKEALHREKCRELEEKGFTVKENTVSALKGNLLGAIIPIPAMILFFIAARLTCALMYPQMEYKYNSLATFGLFVLFVFLHEVTHGVFAAIHCKNGWKSIKLGFNVEGLNPYCACAEPMKVKHYRLFILAPLFVEGILPIIVGVLIGTYELILAGLLMVWSAGGDMLIWFMLRKENKDSYAIDHPYLIGCTVLSKTEQQ